MAKTTTWRCLNGKNINLKISKWQKNNNLKIPKRQKKTITWSCLHGKNHNLNGLLNGKFFSLKLRGFHDIVHTQPSKLCFDHIPLPLNCLSSTDQIAGWAKMGQARSGWETLKFKVSDVLIYTINQINLTKPNGHIDHTSQIVKPMIVVRMTSGSYCN